MPLNKENFELLINENRVVLLEKIHYLIKTKKLDIQDVQFCVLNFVSKNYLSEAVILLREATRNYPNNVSLLKIFTSVLTKLNLYDEAIFTMNSLLSISRDAETFTLFSLIYKKIGKLDLVLKVLAQGVCENPSSTELLLSYGNELYGIGDFVEAKKVYKTILSYDDNSVSACVNLGVMHKELGEYKEALSVYEKALKNDPENSGVYNNMGVLFKTEKKFLKAFQCIRKALDLNANNVDAYANMGTILKETNKPRWALKYFEKTLSLNPLHVNANLDYAITQLLLGNYKKGFLHYQFRMKMKEMASKFTGLELKKNYKKGTDIKNKRILVFGEQGFGDAIQFVRYIDLLRRKGAFVILRVRKELKQLFEKNNIADRIILENEIIEYDYHMALLSIPYQFDIDVLKSTMKQPYLKVQKNNNKEKSIKKIAFAFAGSPTHKAHESRFINPEKFAFLSKLKNTNIFTLQMGDEKDKLEKSSFYESVIDKTNEIKDFYDTAVILNDMDLLITSDTSMAHLGGALGINTWVCLPSNPDWRWGQYNENTFWYPSVKLFRQEKKGNWDGAFENIELKLKDNNN